MRFALPEIDERKRLWQAMIPSKAPIAGAVSFDGLAQRFVMSGGHIRNAVMRAAFLAADEQTSIHPAHFARAAQLEYEALGKVSTNL